MFKYSSPFIDKFIIHIINCYNIEAGYFPSLRSEFIP